MYSPAFPMRTRGLPVVEEEELETRYNFDNELIHHRTRRREREKADAADGRTDGGTEKRARAPRKQRVRDDASRMTRKIAKDRRPMVVRRQTASEAFSSGGSPVVRVGRRVKRSEVL